MSKRKRPSVSPQWFYVSFFLAYFALLYLALYHAGGLQPFQVSHHFTSNVVGSLFKRFLGDAIPYAILFSVMYYSKRKWLRLSALVAFLAIFAVNTIWIGYFFFAKANLQLYVIQAFRWSLLKTFLNVGVTLALLSILLATIFLSYALMSLKSQNGTPPTRKIIVAGLLLALSGYQGYIAKPIYDFSIELFAGDSLMKKTISIVQMDESGIQSLTKELKAVVYKPNITEKELSELEQQTLARLGLDQHLSTDFSSPAKKIVLIVVESLNQSLISAYNPQIPGITPHLDELLAKYPRVDEFYPSGPFTIHGLSTMLCGHTNMDYSMKNPAHECIPKLLSKAGYTTEFIRGFSKYYIGENVIFKKFGFDTVFAKEELDEKFPSFKEQRPDLHKTWGFSDDYLFDEAVKRLEEAKPEDKLFLTLLTVDTHTPGGRCSEGRATKEENQILFSVSCLDRYIGDFMAQLEKKDLLNEDTIVLITSDQLLPNASKVPGDLFQVSFAFPPSRIPFLMISEPPIELMALKGSQVDIASTILDTTNTPIPNYYMGKSLISDPLPLPTGKDGGNTYAILGDQFNYFPSLFKTPEPIRGPISTQIQFNSDEDLQEKLEAIRKERDAGISENTVLHKWYHNKYYWHDLSH